MGREASCRCRWGTEEAEVRALLETDELIVHGGMRRTVPLASIRDVLAQADSLHFRVGPDRVVLKLGAPAAVRWAKAISEPPDLAKKLGISNTKAIRVIGFTEDHALREAFAKAGSASGTEPEVVFLVVRTPEELREHLTRAEAHIDSGASVWVVYPKGKGKGISEAEVRNTLRERCMIDTKVARVSEELTGLRFSQRRAERPNAKSR